MALIDYKFTNIQHTGNLVHSLTVRFYRGDITTENEDDLSNPGTQVPTTRYRRAVFLGERTWTPERELTRRQIVHTINQKIRERFPAVTRIVEQQDEADATDIGT